MIAISKSSLALMAPEDEEQLQLLEKVVAFIRKTSTPIHEQTPVLLSIDIDAEGECIVDNIEDYFLDSFDEDSSIAVKECVVYFSDFFGEDGAVDCEDFCLIQELSGHIAMVSDVKSDGPYASKIYFRSTPQTTSHPSFDDEDLFCLVPSLVAAAIEEHTSNIYIDVLEELVDHVRDIVPRRFGIGVE